MDYNSYIFLTSNSKVLIVCFSEVVQASLHYPYSRLGGACEPEMILPEHIPSKRMGFRRHADADGWTTTMKASQGGEKSIENHLDVKCTDLFILFLTAGLTWTTEHCHLLKDL